MKVVKITTPGGPVAKILLRTKSNTQLITLSDIIYCHAERNYTHLHLADGQKYLSSICISKVAALLEKYGFFSPNKSYIINALHLLSFTSGKKYTLKLTNDIEIAISAPKKDILHQLEEK